MLDSAIIALQRLLANRYAIKAKHKADTESQSSGGTRPLKKRRRRKKKGASGADDGDDDDGDDDLDNEEAPDAGKPEKQDSFKSLKKQMKSATSSRDTYLKEKKKTSIRLRKEWSEEGEKAKSFSRILLKFGTKDSGLAHSIANVYSAHDAVSFQPLELQLPRILSKIRAVESDASKTEALMRMYDETFSVARLLQSQIFRSMLMDAIVRLEANPRAGDVAYSKTLSDGTLIDARRLENRRRKAEAKSATLINPGELLAACNTIDECFRLFDEDGSGEIDVDEMEIMQSLIGDFGEELVKELYRITSLKTADETGGVQGLTLEEFTGVFCSTMGITMSDEEDGDDDDDRTREDENDNFDEALVFDRVDDSAGEGDRRGPPASEKERGARGQDDWMDLAGDLDEAATLSPQTTHEQALTIAALQMKKMQLVPHSGSAGAMTAGMNKSASNGSLAHGMGEVPVRSGTAYNGGKMSVCSGATGLGSASNGGVSQGSTAAGRDQKQKNEEKAAEQEATNKKKKLKNIWSFHHWKTTVKACFGYVADAKAEEINAEIMGRIEDAFSHVSKEKDIQEKSVDIKHLGALMQSMTGGREVPKVELEMMVKIFDSDMSHQLTHESFAEALMVLKDDPTLNRLLGQDLSRLLDHRSMHKESSTKLPSDASFFAIHPNNASLRTFKSLVNFVGFFYFFEVPIRITFRVAHRLGPWYLVAVHLVDAVLLVDILVNFCTAYVNKKSVLTYDMRRISKHYLSTTFTMDVVAAFPFDLLAMMSTTRRSATAYVDYTLMAYLRVPKLLRLYRVLQAMKTSNADLRADSIGGVLRRLMPMLVYTNHVGACLLWWVSADTYISSSTSDSLFLRWTGLGTDDIMNVEGTADSEVISVLKQYLVSYFWVTATISTNGRIGDMNPITPAELGFSCVMMVLSLTLYSYALGEVSAAVMKQDEDMVKQRQNILSVESYVLSRGLPEELSNQIREHFDFLAESASVSQGESDAGGSQDIFAQLSHSLQVEVSSYLSRDLIASCTAFRDSDDIFLDSMAVLLREVNMSSDQYLYRVNEVSRELFIISAGIVELTVENAMDGGDNVISIRQRGELCGELSFFFGIRQNTNARTSSSSTASFFCLPKEDYLQLLKLYPEEEENLTRNALAAFDDFSSGKDGQSSYASSAYSGDQGIKAGSSAAGSEASSAALASNVDTNALDDIATVRKVLNVARQKKLNEKIVSLVTAAAKNDISEVSRMLSQGDINIDMGDYDERTPLHLAASNGHLKMVKHLVQIHGADLSVKDRYGGTPMVDAIRHKHDSCAAFLRSQGASLEVDDAAEQLCSAAAKNDVAALRRLVENHVVRVPHLRLNPARLTQL